MDDVGLGQAMGEHYREEMAKRALQNTEALERRIASLELQLDKVIVDMVALSRGIREGH